MRFNSFNPVAEAYSRKVAPRRFSQFLTLVYELDLKGNERVLDVGAGSGELSLEIARRLNNDGSLQGIDLSPNMVRLARKRAASGGAKGNVQFSIGDALNIRFSDGSFDIVVSSNALPWVEQRDRFVEELARVLVPGGRLGLVALSTKCYCEFARAYVKVAESNPQLFPKVNLFEQIGVRLHSIDDLGALVEEAGLELERKFVLSTEEPTEPNSYLDRVDAIVNRRYLDHLSSANDRRKARDLIKKALIAENDPVNITESSVFVIAHKPAISD